MRIPRACAALLCLPLLAAGCSDEERDRDAGPRDGGVEARPGIDAVPDGLPPGYLPYDCPTPGVACNAHDPCAINPVCGPDYKCWPQYMQNCDDKLDCTIDTCQGSGLCLNEPKEGWCALGFPVSTKDGGAGGSEFRCAKVGTKKPGDPCLACNPTTTDAGVSNNTRWMPVSGGSCDDNDACTKDDTCVAGTCKGTYFGNLCADGLGCTTDNCDGKGGCKGNKLKSDWCLISGTCYMDKTKDPTGTCNVCDVTKTQLSWTPITDSCLIGGKCYSKGDKHSGGCAECVPAKSSTSWTVVGTTAGCLIEDSCKKVGEKDDTTCMICDPTAAPYAWTQIAGLCKIGGTCYNKGAWNNGGCAQCVPSSSQSSWTVTTNNCLIYDVCYKSGAKNAINCSACDPAQDRYDWSPIAGRCEISGSCYNEGDKHPEGCAECDTATSSTAWTVKGTTHCLIHNVCRASGVTDSSQCGACDPTLDKYEWSPVSGQCKIDGVCYGSGDKHPGGCGECRPATSTTAWTVTGTGCLIDDTCVPAAASNPAGCGKCDPTKSRTAWSGTGTVCAIDGACFAKDAKDSGGCAVCDPSTSTSSWTKPAGCLAAHAWSKSFGGTSSDYPYAIAVDSNGNVYITGYYYYSINFGGNTLTSVGSNDVFLASFTPAGKHRWSKSFGGTSSDYGYGVATDGEGNVYITGYYYTSIDFGGGPLYSQGSTDVFVASFTSDGKYRSSASFGGVNYDYGQGIAADASGNVYITGYFSGPASFGGTSLSNRGSYDIYLAAYGPTGKHRWSKSFGNTSSDYGRGLAVDSAGNTYLTGEFYTSIDFGGGTIYSSGGTDIFVASFSPSGAYRWSRASGGTSYDYGYGVAVDNSANVFITGNFYGTASFGGSPLTSPGSNSVYLASYTSGGTHRWSVVGGGSSSDTGYGVAADASGNAYITGSYYGSASFGGTTLTGAGYNEIFIASYSPTGAFRWSRSHGATI